jgi:hypothetical protein
LYSGQVFLGAPELVVHKIVQIGGKGFPGRVSIATHGFFFSTRHFSQDRRIAVRGRGRHEMHPATVEYCLPVTMLGGLPPEAANGGVQFRRGFVDALDPGLEQRDGLQALDSRCCRAEAFETVVARLEEIVEHAYGVVC